MGTILGQNDVPRWSHFIIAFLLAFACVAARFLLDKFIFRRLAVWLVRNGPTTNRRVDETTRAKVAKCSESMWKLTYYATVEFWVLSTIYYQPWFVDNKQYIRGWPDHELQPSIALVYMCQCGFYIYSIAALLVWETRRKDFAVMMSHHIITVMLISGSYMTRFFRVGSVVLALHDASDVFMEAAKVFKYSEKEFGASLFFGLFAVSWLVLRLVIFPFWVIWSSCYYMIEVLRLSELLSHVLLYYAFNTMLLTLLVFHLYWWILICSMIRRQLKNRGQVGEDIRSDSEGED